MTLLLLNNKPCPSGFISMPAVGAWTADVAIDSELTPSDKAVLTIGETIWNGFVVQAGETMQTELVRIVGGNGGLNAPVEPKSYIPVPAKIVLMDILGEGGEILSPLCDPAINAMLPAWVRCRCSVGEGLSLIVNELGCTWRVLQDGSVWIGKETWPVQKFEYEVESSAPNTGRLNLRSEEPLVRPGVTLDGRRISRVEHVFSENGARSSIWLEGASDDLLGSISALIRHEMAYVDYFAQYPARVVSQNTNGTLELQINDVRFPGLSAVPIRYGIPGVSVKVAPGSQVAVEFAGGRASAPIATIWATNSVTELRVTATTIILNNGTQPVARVGDMAGPYPISSGNLTVLA